MSKYKVNTEQFTVLQDHDLYLDVVRGDGANSLSFAVCKACWYDDIISPVQQSKSSSSDSSVYYCTAEGHIVSVDRGDNEIDAANGSAGTVSQNDLPSCGLAEPDGDDGGARKPKRNRGGRKKSKR